MKPISEVTACIIDHSLNVGLAVELARRQEFKRVLYHNASWVEAFPKLNKGIIGDGYEGVEIVDDYWLLKKEIDLFIFPDLYHAGEQLELESQGLLVWGSRNGDKTEMYRQRFMKLLAEVGLEVPPHKLITGLTALREHLYDQEDKYIKISKWRGTLETTHWRDWDHDESLLDWWAVLFGPAKERIEFLVFDAIETEIEFGVDTYCVDGEYPDLVIEGVEYKDQTYLGTVKKPPELPEQLQAVLNAFSGELREVHYRNLISCEVRIKDDHFFFTDPTRRFPCPAGNSQLKLYGNLPEIIYHGAAGELVQPEMAGQFSVECVLVAKGSKKLWSEIKFPKELMDFVVCAGSCQIDDKICTPPDDSDDDGIGWLVNIADSGREAIEGILEKAKQLPDGITANTDDLVQVLKDIETAEAEGVPFTNEDLPEPADIVSD